MKQYTKPAQTRPCDDTLQANWGNENSNRTFLITYFIKTPLKNKMHWVLSDFEIYVPFSATRLSNSPTTRSNPSRARDCTSCRRESATSNPRTRSEPYADEKARVRRARLGRHLGSRRAPDAGPESCRQGEELARILRGLRPRRALHPIVRTLPAPYNTGTEAEIRPGRSDKVKDKTTAWLADHGLSHLPIGTRRAGRAQALVFEDRASIAVWPTPESNGNEVAEHDLSHVPEPLAEMPPGAGPLSPTKAPASRGGARLSAARSANSRLSPAGRTASGTGEQGRGVE